MGRKPTVLNSSLNFVQFRDDRADSLKQQAARLPIPAKWPSRTSCLKDLAALPKGSQRK